MKKILTIILDGFGITENEYGNAVKLAKPSNFIKLWEQYPHCKLNASGESVGIREGQFGNSEVGHMTIGAGRIIKQGAEKIEDLFKLNLLKDVPNYQEMVNYVLENDKPLHIMYLASEGGVHSYNEYAKKMLVELKKSGVENIYFHLITDGRDTDPKSSRKYIVELLKTIQETGIGKIATVCGRYYAMDRDKNWERTKLYYDLVTKGIGNIITDFNGAVEACYKKNVTDEFLPPMLINQNGLIKSDDCLLWLNYRADRAKQILKAISNSEFDAFPSTLENIKLYSFLEIDDDIITNTLVKNDSVENALGSYISKLGMSQARIAETEKYAHVTYFFDGGQDLDLEKSDRFLIPSPKVATYDLKPEMSAVEVTKAAIRCMEDDYDFILMNYANPDMVGHTGNVDATIKAIQAVDICLGKLFQVAEENFYTLVILADHGNAEKMIDNDGKPITSHTTNLVPFIITDKKVKLVNGGLSMVAPTILKYMDIALPQEMKKTDNLFYEDEE